MESKNEQEHDMPSSTTELDDTTVNVVAAKTESVKLTHLKDLVDGITNVGKSGPDQDIKAFLARPVVLTTTVLDGSINNGIDLTSVDLPSDMVGRYVTGTLTGGIPLIKNKISGFMGFRSDFKMKVQVNANQFQQGMLLLHYVPYTYNQTTEGAAWNHTLVQQTQHYSTILDISCDTEVEFEIPFIYPGPYYDYVKDTNSLNLGTFYVTVYSKLEYGTGSANAEVTVWGSMHNVELIGPVIPLAQSSDFKLSKKVIGVSDKEKKTSGSEKQDSSLTVIANSTAEIASKVPLLSSFAQPLRWFGRMINEPASYFGFSTPNMTVSPMPTQRFNLPWFNNADQPRITQIIGVNSDAAVGHLPGFAGTEVDEMDISSIVQRFAFHKRATWSTEDEVDDQVMDITIQPNDFTTTTTVGAYTIYNMIPAGYISTMFTLWRGSMRLRFRIVKTGFHSGRLLLSFMPGQQATYSPLASMTNANSQYIYRQIIDIREGNVFEITIPFICVNQWLRYNQQSGIVRVTVLNPLRAPDTVKNSVDVILEAAGGEDMEFALPKLADRVPWTPNIVSALDIAEAQASPCEITTSVVGGATLQSDNGSACGYTIGEKVVSTRQMIKKLTYLRCSTTTTTTTLDIAPFAIYCRSFNGVSAVNTPWFYSDTLSLVGAMYALQRGSVTYVCDSVGSTRIISTLYDATGIEAYRTTAIVDAVGTGNLLCANTIINDSNVVMTPINVPNYSYNHSRLNHWFTVTTDTTQTNPYSSPVRLNLYRNNTAAPRLWRAAGDDFSFGQFVACPPLVSNAI